MTSRQIRALLGLVVVLVLALLAAKAVSVPVGLGVLVLGILAIFVVLQRSAEDDPHTAFADLDPEPKPKRKKKAASADPSGGLDLFGAPLSFDDPGQGGSPLTTRQPTGPAPEPLQTWTPPEPLQTWTPPSNRALDSGVEAPAFDDNPWGTPLDSESIDALAQPWDETDPWGSDSPWNRSSTTTESNPLDDLDRLDEVDIIAEVERLDSVATLEAVDAFSTPINEEVENPDDIMAASEATELTVGASDNTELAKLLAKVQQRLAAYE